MDCIGFWKFTSDLRAVSKYHDHLKSFSILKTRSFHLFKLNRLLQDACDVNRYQEYFQPPYSVMETNCVYYILYLMKLYREIGRSFFLNELFWRTKNIKQNSS